MGFVVDTLMKAAFIYVGYYGFRTVAWIMFQ